MKTEEEITFAISVMKQTDRMFETNDNAKQIQALEWVLK